MGSVREKMRESVGGEANMERVCVRYDGAAGGRKRAR